MRLRIGARRNALGKAYADMAVMLLKDANPSIELEILYISKPSMPDENSIGTELQWALSDGVIDVSVEDMSAWAPFPETPLCPAAVLMRADPRDALVTSSRTEFHQLKPYAKVYTGNIARGAQLRALRPDLDILTHEEMREASLFKLKSGIYDAIVAPYADFIRFNQPDIVDQVFGVNEIIPTPGQGAIVMETRAEDPIAYSIITAINHEPSRLAVLAELEMCAALDPDADKPVAAYGNVQAGKLRLVGMVCNPDGSFLTRNGIIGDASDAIYLGRKLADLLTEPKAA